MAMWKCPFCNVEVPDFDVSHVCTTGPYALNLPVTQEPEVQMEVAEDLPVVAKTPEKVPEKIPMWKLGIMIHGYRLQQTCSACPEQYDVFDDLGQQVAYFRLRHGGFRVNVPDVGGDVVYSANPQGDGCFMEHERVRYLTDAIMAVQEYYINRRWDKESNW